MSGLLVALLPPTTIDLSDLSTVGGSSFALPLAQRVDLTAAESATLGVRVHLLTLTQLDTLLVDVFPHGQTYDDPSLDFAQSATSLVGGGISLTTAPAYKPGQLTLQFGGLVGVRITATRDLQFPGTTLMARISLELYLKTGGTLAGGVMRERSIFHGYDVQVVDDLDAAIARAGAAAFETPSSPSG